MTPYGFIWDCVCCVLCRTNVQGPLTDCTKRGAGPSDWRIRRPAEGEPGIRKPRIGKGSRVRHTAEGTNPSARSRILQNHLDYSLFIAAPPWQKLSQAQDLADWARGMKEELFRVILQCSAPGGEARRLHGFVYGTATAPCCGSLLIGK